MHVIAGIEDPVVITKILAQGCSRVKGLDNELIIFVDFSEYCLYPFLY